MPEIKDSVNQANSNIIPKFILDIRSTLNTRCTFKINNHFNHWIHSKVYPQPALQNVCFTQSHLRYFLSSSAIISSIYSPPKIPNVNVHSLHSQSHQLVILNFKWYKPPLANSIFV